MKIFFDHWKNDVDFYDRLGVKRPLIRFCLGRVFTNPAERYVVVFIALPKATLWFRLGVRCVKVKGFIEADCEQARLEERAKIVAHIVQVADRIKNDPDGMAWGHLQAMAIAIEAGEHLK